VLPKWVEFQNPGFFTVHMLHFLLYPEQGFKRGVTAQSRAGQQDPLQASQGSPRRTDPLIALIAPIERNVNKNMPLFLSFLIRN
jgi:hypothetical protein